MLNKYEFEQNSRVYTETAVIFTVQVSNKFIDFIKVDWQHGFGAVNGPLESFVPDLQFQSGCDSQYF